MPSKTPITRKEYEQLLSEGYSADDLNAEGLVIAPEMPSRAQTAPKPAANPKQGDGYSRLASLGRDMLNPKRWGQAAMAGADMATFGLLDEAAAGVMGGGEYNRKAARETLNRANQESGYMGDVAQVAGAVAGPGISGAKLASRIPANVRGASLMRQAAAGAIGGGASGALTGAASAEPGSRVRGGVAGGIGGLLGGALLSGAIVPAARAVGRYAGVLPQHKNELVSDALQEVVERLGVSGKNAPARPRSVSPQDYDPKTAEFAASLGRTGKPDDMRVMDLNRELQELSVDAAKGSRAAEKQLEGITTERALRQNKGITSDVEDALGLAGGDDARDMAGRLGDKIAGDDVQRFGPVWEAYGTTQIKDPQIKAAWNDVVDVLNVDRGILDRQKLRGGNPADLIRQTPQGQAPTLRAIHEAKIALQKQISAIEEAPALGQSISSVDAERLGSLQAAKERLVGLDLNRVPGGAEYKAALAASAKDRAVKDQLEVGMKDVLRPNRAGGDVARIREQAVRGQDPTTARRATGALKRGVASAVARKAGGGRAGRESGAAQRDAHAGHAGDGGCARAGRHTRPQVRGADAGPCRDGRDGQAPAVQEHEAERDSERLACAWRGAPVSGSAGAGWHGWVRRDPHGARCLGR